MEQQAGNLASIFPGGFQPLRESAPDDPYQAFLDTLAAHGLQVETLRPDTHRPVRVRSEDDDADEKSGWYRFWLDPIPHGVYGDWRLGTSEKWSARDESTLDPQTLAAVRKAHEEAARRDREERERLQQAAAEEAAKIVAQCTPAPANHPYLKAKGIQPLTALLASDARLVIPIYDERMTLVSLQYIAGDGKKRFLTNGKIDGCFHLIGEPGPKILEVEGFATGASLHQATRLPVAVAFNATNLPRAARKLHSLYPAARLVLCADNDQWRTDKKNVGLQRANEAAATIPGSLVVIPRFREEHAERKPKDFNDLAALEGLVVAREQVEQTLNHAVISFQFLQVADFAAGKQGGWFIKHVLPRATLGMVYGESGSGKSFAVLDFAACVAQGKPWNNHKTNRARVGYIAAESGGGMRKRLLAYAQYYQLDLSSLPFYAMAESPSLMRDESVGHIVQSIQACGGLDIIFIDTLIAASPGINENASDDMGAVLWRCQRIHEVSGCMVVLVHHSGKDASRGARGWSGVKGAMDVCLEVSKSEKESDARQILVEKLKDGADGLRFGFRLQELCIGFDEDREEITSCVAVSAEAPAPRSRGRRKGSGSMADVALKALHEALAEHGESMPGSSTVPRGVRAVTIEKWRGRFRLRYGAGEDMKDDTAFRMAFMRAKEALLKEEKIIISAAFVWET